MAEGRKQQQGDAPAEQVDAPPAERQLSGDELERSVSDQELGPHQHKATPAPGTYEEPRPHAERVDRSEQGYRDAGQQLADRANGEQEEREREARG